MSDETGKKAAVPRSATVAPSSPTTRVPGAIGSTVARNAKARVLICGSTTGRSVTVGGSYAATARRAAYDPRSKTSSTSRVVATTSSSNVPCVPSRRRTMEALRAEVGAEAARTTSVDSAPTTSVPPIRTGAPSTRGDATDAVVAPIVRPTVNGSAPHVYVNSTEPRVGSVRVLYGGSETAAYIARSVPLVLVATTAKSSPAYTYASRTASANAGATRENAGSTRSASSPRASTGLVPASASAKRPDQTVPSDATTPHTRRASTRERPVRPERPERPSEARPSEARPNRAPSSVAPVASTRSSWNRSGPVEAVDAEAAGASVTVTPESDATRT